MTESDPPASPCIAVCRLDAAGTLCIGCYRTLDEIAGWAAADRDRRTEIVARAAERRRAQSGKS